MFWFCSSRGGVFVCWLRSARARLYIKTNVVFKILRRAFIFWFRANPRHLQLDKRQKR